VTTKSLSLKRVPHIVDPPIKSRPQISDIDLIRRAQMDDFSAYGQLVRRYHRPMYGFIYGMTHCSEEAKRLTTVVFTKAWKARGYFRESSDFHTWIYQIAIHQTLKLRKKIKSLFGEHSELDIAKLIALKVYERPDENRAEKMIEYTLLAVHAAHKKPTLLLGLVMK